MWISNTFIHQKWVKSKQKQRNGVLANIIPPGNASILGRRQALDQSSNLLKGSTSSRVESVKYKDAVIDQKNTEGALVNACNIGTALMVVNSYRTLAIMWAITGVFPCFLCLMSSLRNDSAFEMTSNLQGVNLMAQNSSSNTCDFLTSSIRAWAIASITQSFGDDESPSLLTLEVGPDRCDFNTSFLTCDSVAIADDDSRIGRTCDLWSSYQNVSIPADVEEIASANDIRVGSIIVYEKSTPSNFTNVTSNVTTIANYTARTSFDFSFSVQET